MTTVTISQYTLQEGDPMSYSCLVNGSPVCAVKRSYAEAAEIGRVCYHQTRAPKRLVHWNGDTSTETLLDETR